MSYDFGSIQSIHLIASSTVNSIINVAVHKDNTGVIRISAPPSRTSDISRIFPIVEPVDYKTYECIICLEPLISYLDAEQDVELGIERVGDPIDPIETIETIDPIIISKCKHKCKIPVHQRCLDTWLDTKNICIICRKKLKDNRKNSTANSIIISNTIVRSDHTEHVDHDDIMTDVRLASYLLCIYLTCIAIIITILSLGVFT